MGGILVIAEHFGEAIREITREMIGAAISLRADIGGPVVVAILSDGAEALAGQLNISGVDEIRVCETGSPHFDLAVYEDVTCSLGAELRPRLILFGHTANGMACAATTAARLGSGFASDVFGLRWENDGLIVTRGAYGNKLNVELAFPKKAVAVLSIRSATFAPATAAGSAHIVDCKFDLSNVGGRTKHLEYVQPVANGPDISKAEFILSVGRGIQEEKNIPRFMQLANKIGATFGCSRPVVDAGWLPKSHQIGQSGKVAANCKLYIAFGISGAVQHLHGMKHVETIVAINTDASAPIFGVATYGATVDIFEFADALESQFN
ncbi:MAG: electron transfer flavoprotein subunit alpha/FixB family protein [Proteobacteria bacterium]|nr:electron transfer flavoprotein subunit alpha/FixB family protein [Pseudomonadota bacterium]